MFDKKNFGNLMKQAQIMQDNMEKIQKEINSIEVIGESGAGLIKITINGLNHCKNVTIDPSLLLEKIEILEDLTTAAFNDAIRRINEEKKKKMSSSSTGIPLPTNFNNTI